MKTFFISVTLLILLSQQTVAQNKFDNNITVLMLDTVGLHIKLKTALANSNFIVKDNSNKDTLITHIRPLANIPGYMAVAAIISGNTISLTGIYGLNRVDGWGMYINTPKNYNKVVYYKGSKTWQELTGVAVKLQGEISYQKIK